MLRHRLENGIDFWGCVRTQCAGILLLKHARYIVKLHLYCAMKIFHREKEYKKKTAATFRKSFYKYDIQPHHLTHTNSIFLKEQPGTTFLLLCTLRALR